MNKQTLLSLGFAGLAISIGALLYLAAPALRSDLVSQQTTHDLPKLPVLEAEDAPTFTQPEARFNETEPSVLGTITAINGTKIDLDVVEQPKDLAGTIVNRRVVRVSAARAATLVVGQQITVFVAQQDDLMASEIPATRVEVLESE